MADKGLIIQRRPDGSKFIYNFSFTLRFVNIWVGLQKRTKDVTKIRLKIFFFIFKNHVIENGNIWSDFEQNCYFNRKSTDY